MERDVAVRDLLHYALRLDDHEVEAVSCWIDMLQALASGRVFDAVLSEILIPQDQDHIEAIAMAERRGIPVLLMTGDTGTMVELDRRQVFYLEKPFQIERLMNWVNERVRRAPSKQDGSVN